MAGRQGAVDLRALLDRRHRSSVLVIDTPAGFDRSRLIDEAVAAGPPSDVREVVLRLDGGCTPDGVVAALSAELADLGSPDASSSAGSVARALEAVGPVVVVVDQLHRCGDDTVAWFGDLARGRPASVHLVLAGTGLEALRLAELGAEGGAVLVGATDLAVRDSDGDAVDRWPAGARALATGRPDAALSLLGDALMLDVGEGADALVAALLAMEVTRRSVAEAVAGALGDISVWDLRRLPLVTVDRSVVEIHPWWRQVVRADPDLPAAVYSAAAAAASAEGDLAEAGRHAVLARSGTALRSVLRAALATQPPLVSAADLRAWSESQVLSPDDPHSWWLDAATTVAQGGGLEHATDRYEAARTAFEASDDIEAETAVSLAAAMVARRRDDLGALVVFMARAEVMLAAGREEVRAPMMLGQALVAQMSGDPAGALEQLERVPAGSLRGDWAAQLAMMRGTNLLLLGRTDDAVRQLDRATGLGGPWSYSTALDLLATARWRAGDVVGALAEIDRAVDGIAAGGDDRLVRACRAVMLAAAGDRRASREISSMPAGAEGDESDRLVRIARCLLAIDAGDLDAAREVVRDLRVPRRAVRSTTWMVALDTALSGELARWDDLVATHASLRPAQDAGRAARRFLDGGPPPPDACRPFLPAAWHGPTQAVVELQLLGGAEVRRNRRPVEHRNWERGRVRELCLFMALNRTGSRDLAADLLWPDLASAAAAKNLRVTLSYLLDVLDPDRPKGSGSTLVEDGAVLRLVDADDLRIDVRDLLVQAQAVLRSAAADDPVGVVGAARRLVRGPRGRPLGGTTVGDWAAEYDEIRRDLVLRAVAVAGPVALDRGLPVLAEELGRRGLEEDPWAERLHQMVVRSRLLRDDLDGARRALRDALEVLGELGVRPEPTTERLARQLGVR